MAMGYLVRVYIRVKVRLMVRVWARIRVRVRPGVKKVRIERTYFGFAFLIWSGS